MLKKTHLLIMVLICLFLAGVNCGGGSGSSGTTGTVSSTTGTVSSTTGTLTAPDGTPMAGATVALVESSATSSLIKMATTNKHGQKIRLPKLTDADGDTCDDVGASVSSGDIIASDCTGSNGEYTLTGEIPCGESITLYAKLGSFELNVSLTITCAADDDDGNYDDADLSGIAFDDDCTTDSSGSSGDDDSETMLKKLTPDYSLDTTSCEFSIASMAVVTGYYDEIQNVLAKLGYGTVDSTGVLETPTTEAEVSALDFTLIDGTGYLDDDLFDNFEDFISDIDNLTPYDIIFINCGNSDEDLATTYKAVLQEYVEGGGKLYITDWSYMFVESPFPSFMDFMGGGDDLSTSEWPTTSAKIGDSDITSDATVNDATLKAWLGDDDVTVNDGDMSDYEDCYGLDDTLINAKEGALNADETITIGDFLSDWVVMDGAHTGVDIDPKIWITGPVSYTGSSGTVDEPLTVTREEGEGRILYTSYHTAHSCPTTGFWPQERILQYLVFEL